MGRINITIEIEDNDLVELAMERELRELFGSSIKDYQKLLNDMELYKTDHKYREICMKQKAIKRAKYEYYDKNRDIK